MVIGLLFLFSFFAVMITAAAVESIFTPDELTEMGVRLGD